MHRMGALQLCSPDIAAGLQRLLKPAKSPLSRGAGSEPVFQRELDYAWIGCGVDDLAEAAAADIDAWYAEIGMIQDVEELGAELYVLLLGNPQSLAQIEIDVEHIRPSHDADTRITERLKWHEAVASRVALKDFERCGVEVTVNRALAVR